jgi:hypothetical protein
MAAQPLEVAAVTVLQRIRIRSITASAEFTTVKNLQKYRSKQAGYCGTGP